MSVITAKQRRINNDRKTTRIFTGGSVLNDQFMKYKTPEGLIQICFSPRSSLWPHRSNCYAPDSLQIVISAIKLGCNTPNHYCDPNLPCEKCHQKISTSADVGTTSFARTFHTNNPANQVIDRNTSKKCICHIYGSVTIQLKVVSLIGTMVE